MDGCYPEALLKSPDDEIDIEGIKFDQTGMPLALLCSDHGRSRPPKEIENAFASFRGVQNGVTDHGNRLDRGMGMELFHAAGCKAVEARIFPDIGAVSAETAQLDIVGVGLAALARYPDKLMAALSEKTG